MFLKCFLYCLHVIFEISTWLLANEVVRFKLLYTVCKIELVLSYVALLCVVLQKAATSTQIYFTATTSECCFGSATRGGFVSIVRAVDARSLPPRKFHFPMSWKIR